MLETVENPILQCRNLTKRYGASLALNAINLTIPRGKIVGLLGANGSGKTTLMKLASGILTPTSGEIIVCGQQTNLQTKTQVSYLPDKNYLPDWMKVADIIDYFGDFYQNFDKSKAFDMLRRLGISERDRLKHLSKGNKEKVQLILVMSRNAELYLLDEPIGGVDPAVRDYILNTIISNYSENATVLISTHLIADVEKILDEVNFIANGQLVLSSSVDDIRENQGKSVDVLFREVFRC
ncbi:ABC transporter ATP-binding protein [Paludicola sp. MB14-C6]|uniref:ABC transporter ATP-binding protein n=1 Tax=Paludihabitans sp. MB14-C6 TaxID=3070656 RepID=UPI0027DAD4AC|nr:ABC transporter ATP-binding protein [Paludicola sp. MB14-C6]WMJ23997.1 ABC transporter ATP-binding protein [Paludicola sp. MB14-C6]